MLFGRGSKSPDKSINTKHKSIKNAERKNSDAPPCVTTVLENIFYIKGNDNTY